MGSLAKSAPSLRLDLTPNVFHDWFSDLSQSELQTRFQVALLVSFVLHLVVVVGVTIRPPDRYKPDMASTALDVVLVNSRTTAAPEKPDALAQANLDGGGNTDAPRQARSPLPLRKHESAEVAVAVETRKVEARNPVVQKTLTQPQEPAPAVAQPDSARKAEDQVEPVRGISSAEIINRGIEVARLEAQIAKNWDSYQKRPRRRFFGARTQEFRFARYIEDWRMKIERIGTLNYPAAARDQGIYGMLQLTVAIRPDGSVESVEINRPSGQKILDEAALRIVNLAAPFAAFPPDIARDTDILSITRTWSFTRTDQFQAE
jgi:protein TonB